MGEELVITDEEGSPVFKIDGDTNELVDLKDKKKKEEEEESNESEESE